MSVLEAVQISATVIDDRGVYTDVAGTRSNALTAPFTSGSVPDGVGGALGDETVFGQMPDRPLSRALAGVATSILGHSVSVYGSCAICSGRILGAVTTSCSPRQGLQGPGMLAYTMLATAMVGGCWRLLWLSGGATSRRVWLRWYHRCILAFSTRPPSISRRPHRRPVSPTRFRSVSGLCAPSTTCISTCDDVPVARACGFPDRHPQALCRRRPKKTP